LDINKLNGTLWVIEFPFRSIVSSEIQPPYNTTLTITCEPDSKFVKKFQSFNEAPNEQIILNFEDNSKRFSFKVLCDLDEIYNLIKSLKNNP